jgi:UrcA family protein
MNMTQGIRASMLALAPSALTSQAMAGGALFADALVPPLPSATVRFNDLNMSTPAGGRALLARINNAASQVCRTSAEWYPTAWASYRECYLATVDRIVSKLNLSQLTAVYAQEQQRSSAEPSLHARNRGR